MKFCYANRRMTLYPNSVDPWDLAPKDYTDEFLTKVKEMLAECYLILTMRC